MNPSTHYASFKKIHLFLRRLVEGNFLFCLFFTLSFIFKIYSFQISLAVSGDTVL
jgi:hypothetical protein